MGVTVGASPLIRRPITTDHGRDQTWDEGVTDLRILEGGDNCRQVVFGARMLGWGTAGGDPYRATDGSILVRMPAPDLLMGSRPRAVPPAPLVPREFFRL